MSTKLAFTGDLSFHNIEKYTNDPFKNVAHNLFNLNCVVNLESVFLPKSYTQDPIKKKICLRQDDSAINHLIKINPFLINLSNNHINDYGNFGAKYTQQILESEKISYFGAGFNNENHNVFVLKDQNVVFLSYATRSCDSTKSKLFDEKNFIGPKELNLDLLKKQIEDYTDYTKIVLLHWGLEQKHYPLPEQRKIARKLVDCGVDLIIGNHSHVIQGYEMYKNKWIFYSLGNFLFPNLKLHIKQKIYYLPQSKKNRMSIIPIFNISKTGIVLDNLISIKANKKFELEVDNSVNGIYNRYLFSNEYIYSIFYALYSFYVKMTYYSVMPIRIVKKRLYSEEVS
ncbi:Capsule biosynthesis protein capA [Methanosarcina sp. MTP4]|uniref:CapA family protein n=1 Tax=Methanosarcina sp. MTP4 TaxID=1434100 RepID=UPI000615696A|nr:CapA family protein [Methanosarcina sp. MTP4]AKB24329.1 Capsule biosynthesis protein capA [Methanosarcina sp. MTP4]